MNKSFCLVGNPNCGKTTLFNFLTGSNQKVGNWAGVTVDKKEGELKWDKSVSVIDLPGIYSLSPLSLDEKVVVDYLKKAKTDIIINVLDGTNLERNLYLTLNLLKLGIPIIVAVNMVDELKREGTTLNVKKMSEILGVPVFPVSGKSKEGINELIKFALSFSGIAPMPLGVSEDNIHSFIEKHVKEFINKTNGELKAKTEKIDKVLTHGIFGYLIFAIVMFGVYFLSLKLGGVLGDKMAEGIGVFGDLTAKFLLKTGVNAVSVDLLVNAVFKGVGTVLSFLPHLLIMFSLMTALEESGYTARVALLFDKLFSSLSLSGKSVIPFVLSCGCTVAGIEATRTVESAGERELTVMLAPFLPCGAKSAVFGWFSHVFFGGSVLIALSLYVLSILVVIIVAKVYSVFQKNDKNSCFILELPPLRVPKMVEIFSVLRVKAKEFLIKSGTIILSVSIGVWVLTNFGFRGYTAGNINESFLYLLGNEIKYIFYPLGFFNPESSVSIIAGLLAKESVAQTMQILSSHPQTLFNNAFSVYAFMAFTLLSPPCVASISASKRELKDNKKVIKMIVMEFIVAYLVALLINLIGIILTLSLGLILSIIIAIIVFVIFALCVKNVIKRKCKGECSFCKRVNCETKNNVRLYERG